MRHALIAAALLATPLAAEPTDSTIFGEPELYYGATTARLQPTEVPNAIAEVLFNNVEVNKPQDVGTRTLTMGDLSVEVTFGFNVAPGGADSLTVDTPPGYIAIPATLILQEGTSGVILIYHDNMM